MKLSGLTAEQILANPLMNDAARHFAQSASWLDYLLRTQMPSAVHYAAIELRYGIEYLLAELLVLNGKLMSEEDYQACLGNTFGLMKGQLGNAGAKYEKLAKFTKIVVSPAAFTAWDLKQLSKSWGVASKYLHFCGSHLRTYRDQGWLMTAIADLQAALKYPLDECTRSPATAVMRPDGMQPEIYEAWLAFEAGTLSSADLGLRLKLIEPVLAARHSGRG